jgi:hypothetical protein
VPRKLTLPIGACINCLCDSKWYASLSNKFGFLELTCVLATISTLYLGVKWFEREEFLPEEGTLMMVHERRISIIFITLLTLLAKICIIFSTVLVKCLVLASLYPH